MARNEDIEALTTSLDAHVARIAHTAHLTTSAIGIEIDELLPTLAVRWHVDPDGSASLAFSAKLLPSGRVRFAMGRVGAVMPLLLATALHGASGSVTVSVDDVPNVPSLAFSGNAPDRVLIPNSAFLESRGYTEFRARFQARFPRWEDRRPLAFWRGATTGRQRPWRTLQRVRLCEVAKEHPELLDAAISHITPLTENDAAEVAASGLVGDWTPPEAMLGYRYQVDVNGNVNARSGLYQRLLSGSAVLKVASVEGYRQWYYDRLSPS